MTDLVGAASQFTFLIIKQFLDSRKPFLQLQGSFGWVLVRFFGPVFTLARYYPLSQFCATALAAKFTGSPSTEVSPVPMSTARRLSVAASSAITAASAPIDGCREPAFAPESSAASDCSTLAMAWNSTSPISGGDQHLAPPAKLERSTTSPRASSRSRPGHWHTPGLFARRGADSARALCPRPVRLSGDRPADHSRSVAGLMNRGHDFRLFSRAVKRVQNRNLDICIRHSWLPGESRTTCWHGRRTGLLADSGVKIHNLHVVETLHWRRSMPPASAHARA